MDENTAGRQWKVDEQKRQNAAMLQNMLGQVAMPVSESSWPGNANGAYLSNGTASTIKATQGIKHDANKPRMDLLDSDALEGLAKVLTFGATKYDAHNWRGGIAYSRLVAALLRHVSAMQRGEDIDPESGLPHIDHAGCCWMFLSHFTKNRPDLDDRYKGTK